MITRDSPLPTYVGAPTDFVRGLRLEAIKPFEDGRLRREAKTSNLYPLTSNCVGQSLFCIKLLLSKLKTALV